MNYLLYKITNFDNGKELLGKYVGKRNWPKPNHSGNKILKEDLQKTKNYRKEILKKFNNEEDLINAYNILLPDYKNKDNSYNNFDHKISLIGKSNIKKGKIKAGIELLEKRYPKFIRNIRRIGTNNFELTNYCSHGNITIAASIFVKKYHIGDNLYCNKCIDNYIDKAIIENLNIDEYRKIFIENLINPKHREEKYIKFFYPILWKVIMEWSKNYKDISFSERTFLFLNNLKNKPKCLCCDKEVKYGKTVHKFISYCEDHIDHHRVSIKETELLNFIKNNYSGEIIANYKINNKEIDIYLPDLKLGIEFNGLYWHSEEFKERGYHYDKLQLLNQNGIRLINIWEDDWYNKTKILKSILLNSLNKTTNKIFARKTIIKEVKSNSAKKFIDENHLQGFTPAKIYLGLYYNEELVSLMSFGKRRMILGKSNNINFNEYELLRFCNKLNFLIIGGSSKLFNYFLKTYNPSKIISYANLDFSEGNVYKILGFKNLGWTGLNYWWAKGLTKYHRSTFMRHKLGEISNRTADEILHERGFYKIWGNGNLLFEYKNSVN